MTSVNAKQEALLDELLKDYWFHRISWLVKNLCKQ